MTECDVDCFASLAMTEERNSSLRERMTVNIDYLLLAMTRARQTVKYLNSKRHWHYGKHSKQSKAKYEKNYFVKKLFAGCQHF
jgi:hypothetical protein